MRSLAALLVVPTLTAGLLALPTVSVPAASAAPAPVTPAVRELSVAGIDPVALTRSPRPEHEDEHAEAAASGGEAAPDTAEPEEAPLTPVAVTRELGAGEFSALGVTWTPDPRLDEVAVQARTRAGGRWSPWTELEVQLNSGTDATSTEGEGSRAGSDMLFVGPSDAVQLRVDSGRVKPRNLTVSLIDPRVSKADAATTDGSSAEPVRLLGGGVAHAAGTAPPYVSRQGWGADESLRKCSPSAASALKGGILHTTATSNDYTAERSPAVMRSMYAYHTKSLGWCDIGYNFVVDKYGTLFEGRSGGIDRPIIGSHTGGFNTSTVGVSMLGDHDLVAPTSETLRMVERVFAWKLGSYGLDPQGTTEYTSAGGSATRYPRGTVVTKDVISGHRDYSAKSCPGNYAYPLLPQIRANTAALVLAGAALPQFPPTTGGELPLPLDPAPGTPASGELPLPLHPAPGTPVNGAPPPSVTPVPAPVDGAGSVPEAPQSLAPISTSTTAWLSSREVRYGKSVSLGGRVAAGASGGVSKPVQVLLRHAGASDWRPLTTVQPDAAGYFRLTVWPRQNTTYGLRFGGDLRHAASGGDAVVRVATSVTAGFTSTRPAVRRKVVLKGTVRSAHAGQRVLRQQLVGGRWRTVGSARISRTGSYSFSLSWTSRGARTYRVLKPADGDHAVGISPMRKVTVR